MQIKDVIQLLDAHSPERAACDWDNVGLLVGDAGRGLNGIYVALDATDQVIDHAIEKGANLIVTHHPMIFSGMKRIVADDFTGRRIMRLTEEKISLYAMHTNFDIYGMAELAAKKMQLSDIEPLDVCGEDDGKPVGIGSVGMVAPEVILPKRTEESDHSLRLKDYAAFIRDTFGLSCVKVFGNPDAPVCRVAVCPGSGKSDIDTAIEKGADTYVTGDIDHHSGIDANMKGLSIIDAGHYGIEHIFIEYMTTLLRQKTDVPVEAEPFGEPYWYL